MLKKVTIKEAVKKTTTFIIVWLVVTVIVIAGAWFTYWQHILIVLIGFVIGFIVAWVISR